MIWLKRFLKVVLIILAVTAVLITGVIVLLIRASRQPAVKENYYEDVAADMPLERKYTEKGRYEVSSIVFKAESDKVGQFRIWFPAEMKSTDSTYPLVVMANGTGVKSSKYEAIFDHLASWGFIVIGNEDESSWDGVSSSLSLDFMLEMNEDSTSIFYRKIDLENIGAAGHSQGGVGAINAVTVQENSPYYKTVYTASMTHLALAKGLQWDYDVSGINISCFMVAGTLKMDAGDGIEGSSNTGIAPLYSLKENYEAISDDVTKIIARRVNTDHGDMLSYADGYMTAWMMYQLKGDAEAANVFAGKDAEILSNDNWQDVERNMVE